MPETSDIGFALNQRTAPNLSFSDFLDLAARLGCIGVEPRNDLGRPLFDGLKPPEAGRLARERGLRLLGLSEVYPFNDWIPSRRDAVASLIAAAHEAGAATISLIPRVDGHGPTGPDGAMLHREILAEVIEMTEETAVVPLVEPIGFPGCSIRRQRDAVAVIEALDAAGRLGIVHDTFQHTLAQDPDFLVDHIRVVHISGFSGGSGTVTQADDRGRVLVDEADSTAAIDQMKTLRSLGYRGPFSFECTAATFQAVGNPREKITASIAYIRDRLAES